MNKIFKKGFTLIELLVVIAIIAIITSIGTANLITAQKQARDSARREIIGNVQNAFEQYYAEFGVYPVGPSEGAAFETNTKPKDPKDPTTTITWGTTASDEYCVCASMEMGNGNSTNAACAWSEASTSMYYCAKNRQ